MLPENFILRDIRISDCRSLTALALNATSFWGYSVDYLRACVEPFTITREILGKWTGSVLEKDLNIIGFYFLSLNRPTAELERLYVTRHRIGEGNGRRLFHSAVQKARIRNCRKIRIEADVNAVPFYERMGAKLTGHHLPDIDDRFRLAELEYRMD